MTSQQSVTVLETPSPDAQAAQADKEAAALKAAQGVTIQTTDRNDAGEQVVTQVQQGAAPETLILGKFKSQDDLAKAYVELEKKLGGLQQAPAQQQQQQASANQQQKQQQTPNNNLPQGETPAQTKAIEAAAAEYAKDHKLSEETIANLEKAGIPRAVTEQYIRGVVAEEQLIEQSAFSVTGGEDGYNRMVEWAASNLPEAEITAFDKAVTQGTLAEMKSAIEGLWARFRASNGFEPGDALRGGNGPANGGEHFKSRHELQAAMNDPRYRMGDMAYHAEVQQKLARSLQMGIQLFAQ